MKKGEAQIYKMRNDSGEITTETNKTVRVFAGLCK